MMSRRSLVHFVSNNKPKEGEPVRVEDIMIDWKQFWIKLIVLIVIGFMTGFVLRCTFS